MADDSVGQFHELMSRATTYHNHAQWQEKLRTLFEALSLCEKPGFPEGERQKQQVLYEIGGVRRRYGQYDQAVVVLEQALHAFEHASPITRAKILGELGVVYRHSNDFSKARQIFHEQYKLARDTATEAEAELCRAIGNEGMSAYNLSQQQQPHNKELLDIAFAQLRERIDRARALHQRLLKEDPKSKYVKQSQVWEAIGMNRLMLCHIAAGDTAEAVRLANVAQGTLTTSDPTVKALCRFFWGHALWNDGQFEAALGQWNAAHGTTDSAIALCKEPSAEHTEYLRLLAEAGVDFGSYDEQGFSALDYAVLSDSRDAQPMRGIILDAFRQTLRTEFETYIPRLSGEKINSMIEQEIAVRLRLSELRRHYRAILQEHIRPELRKENSDSIQNVRTIVASLYAKDQNIQSMFDAFHYVKYSDFQNHKRLPQSLDKMTKSFSTMPDTAAVGEEKDHFIIFFSYRWIGRLSQPPLEGPDDINNTQWRRMMNAIDEFLKKRRDVDPARLSLWLDYACIDQSQPQQKERGVDALPLAVMQCNAMISLVDEEYYDRAWCAVEVMLVRELIQSYRLHDWWEHVLHKPETDRLNGVLRRGRLNSGLDVENLKLTNEQLDRPKIDFLLRQSKLLGKDDA